MNQIRGVTIQNIEIEGQNSPAFVFRASRQKQIFALTVAFVFAIFCLCILLQVGHIAGIVDAPAVAIGVVAVVLLLLSAYGVMLNFKLLGKPLAQVGLVSEGFHFSSATDSVLIPWDEIEEISRIDIHESDQGKNYLGLNLYSPEDVPSLLPILPLIVSRRARYGCDFVYGLRAFEASPKVIETATQIYFHHPELRGEIGTEAGLASLQTHLDQDWRPPTPRPASGLFDPAIHDELMNPQLQKAIESVIADNSTPNRHKLFEILLQTMFCLPSSGKEENEAQLTAIRNEDGTVALAAFSDPAALRRWEYNAPSMLVITAEKLFQLAIDNDFEEISINPAGPVGGKLSREEFVSLAKGVMPD